MKKAKSFPLFAAVAAATALAATVTAAPASAKPQRASAINCSGTLQIGMLAPLTGGAGFLGQEQLSWAKLAVKTLPKTMGLKVKLVPGDAPAEQGPSAAQTVAQKFIANKAMVGIIGGSTSGSVAATSKAFHPAGLAQISSSATRTTLTKGDNQEATKSFFRVIPADDYQGPTDAKYMIDVLKVKNVAIFDFQEPSPGPRRRGREGPQGRHVTSRSSRSQHGDRLLVLCHEGPERRRHRVLPSQKPGDAQRSRSSSPSRARRPRSSAATA